MTAINCRAYKGYICERTIDGKWKIESHYGKSVNTFRECKDIIREKLEILNPTEKQIVLYFKLRFKITDMMEDLRILVAENFGIPVDSTMNYHIYDHMLDIFFRLQKSGHITIGTQEFLEQLFSYNRKVVDQRIMIERLRAHIQNCKGEGLNLGEPDYALLPEREKVEV